MAFTSGQHEDVIGNGVPYAVDPDDDGVVHRHQVEAERFVEHFFALFSNGAYFMQESSIVLVGGEHQDHQDDPPGATVRWGPPLFHAPDAPVRLFRTYDDFPGHTAVVSSVDDVIDELRSTFFAGVDYQVISVDNIASGGDGEDYFSDITLVVVKEENSVTGETTMLNFDFDVHISVGEINTWSVKSIRIIEL